MIVIGIKSNYKKKLKQNKLYYLLPINKNYLVMKLKKKTKKRQFILHLVIQHWKSSDNSHGIAKSDFFVLHIKHI